MGANVIKVRFMCEECGSVVKVKFDTDPPQKLTCRKCLSDMTRLPPKISNHFHPTKKKGQRRGEN